MRMEYGEEEEKEAVGLYEQDGERKKKQYEYMTMCTRSVMWVSDKHGRIGEGEEKTKNIASGRKPMQVHLLLRRQLLFEVFK